MAKPSRSDLLRRLGISRPIVQAPMAGGPSTPELAAAVTNAGALGSLGVPYLSPDRIADEVRRTRALTSGPINVNLFAGGYATENPVDPAPMLEALAEAHAALGIPPPVLPEMPRDPFAAQLEVVLALRPEVMSFTFGIPGADVLARVRALGIAILGTATTVEEGRLLADAGVDAIVAQGAEAGAHRGTFRGPFEAAMVPTIELVRGIAAAVEVPVVASGALMDGRDVARVLEAGAAAAQLGTAFLVCPESGAPDVHKRAILESTRDTTVVTRAFSGRPARGLDNAFIRRIEDRAIAILPFALQNSLTRAMRGAAGERGDARFLSLWAGTGAARARVMPAADLVRQLADEVESDASRTN